MIADTQIVAPALTTNRAPLKRIFRKGLFARRRPSACVVCILGPDSGAICGINSSTAVIFGFSGT
jgi:hypothetical protein